MDSTIQPKHDFTPSTAMTAYENADALSVTVGAMARIGGKNQTQVRGIMKQSFIHAVNGAALLQNFMNAKKAKIDKKKH